MKRCPECRKDYFDDSLMYCLDDGAALIQGSVTDEPATAILPLEDGANTSTLKKYVWLGLGIAALTGLLVLAWKYRLTSSDRSNFSDLSAISLIQMTSDPGYEGEPTFSSDGETMAYVSDRSGNYEIYIQQISGGAYRNISEHPAEDFQPAYSPDGKQIAFVSTRASASSLRWEGYDLPFMGGDIWVMPALGGNPRRVASDGNFPSWSRDGSAIIYTSGPAFDHKIYRVPALGGTPEPIVPQLNPDNGKPRFLLYPSYSSDDAYVLFEADSPTGFGPRDIWVMKVDDGSVQHVAKGMCPKWNADSSGIIYSSAEAGKNFSLWLRPFPILDSAVATPLTVSRGRDVQVTVSKDGKQMAFTGVDLSSNVEVIGFDDTAGKPIGTPFPLTSGKQISYFQTISRDGQIIVFESRQGFGSHLWKIQRGTPAVRLTSDPEFDDTYPRLSPDDRLISFTRKRAKATLSTAGLWIMSSDGANPRQIVEKAGNMAWTGDSKGIVYFSYNDRQLYFIDITSGASHQITNEPGVMPIFVVSVDSKLVVYQSLASGTVDIKTVPVEGGVSQVVVATPKNDYHPFVSPSGRWLYFQPDHKNVLRVPGAGQGWRSAVPEEVTEFPESGLFLDDPQISGDGRHLLYTHGHLTGDIWLLKSELKP